MNTNTDSPDLPEQREHDVPADQEQRQQPLGAAIGVGPKAVEHGTYDDQRQKGEATDDQRVNILGRHAGFAPDNEAGIVADSSGSYPLEIENIGEDTYILISRGHHDPAAFMVAVREAGYDWPLGMPQHMWMKTVPAPKGSDYRAWYSPVDKGTRGAWPCTYVREAFGADRYETLISAATGGKRAYALRDDQ